MTNGKLMRWPLLVATGLLIAAALYGVVVVAHGASWTRLILTSVIAILLAVAWRRTAWTW